MTESRSHAEIEAERLARLRELLILDTPPEPLFDSIAQLASDVCGVPIALMSLVDEERQWFKAKVGLAGIEESARDISFCTHAIGGDTVFEVSDASCDERFAANPLVTGGPEVRFYAGAPLVLPSGDRVGTLCVVDRQPHRLRDEQTAMLRALARIASQALVMRRDLIETSLSVRSRYEKALAASESFLHRTGKVAGVGGWELDLLTQSVLWSDETRRIHEVGPDYVPTLESAAMFYPPEARPAIESAVQRALFAAEGWDVELPFITAKGNRGWVRAVGEVEFEGGEPVRMIGALQDISERKRLEERLAASERFLRQITDNLPVRVAYLDGDSRFRFVNPARAEAFGCAPEQVLGRTHAELMQGRCDPEVEHRLQLALAGAGQRFEFDDLVRGEMRRIEVRFMPDAAESGDVRGVFSTGFDITERCAAEKALRGLTTIFDNTTDYVVQADSQGRIVYMNGAARRVLGFSAEAPVTQRHISEFNTPATNRLFADVIREAVAARGVWLGETTILGAQQRELPVSHMVIAHRDAAGRIDHYSAVMRDISAEVEAKRQLQRQTATLRSVTEAIPAIVAVVGADGRYRLVNGAFERWLGAKRATVIGHTLAEVMGRAEHDRSRPWVERALAGETVHFERTYSSRGGQSHLSISYIPLWAEGGAVDGFVAVAQDITQHRQEEGRLLRLAQRDALTGLLNRSGFEDYLERSLQAGSGPTLAVLYIDLDHFKPVNDRHGHPVGDRLLKSFAERISALVRPTDAVARLGGDEFAIVLSGLREAANADRVAEKIVAAARRPFEVGELRLCIGASVGVAFEADPALGWRELVTRADAMLYRAKAAGRGRHASGDVAVPLNPATSPGPRALERPLA